MKRNLSAADMDAAKRLKDIITTSPKRLTQGQIAKELGFESQGVISQYINGKIKLGTLTTMKFAKLFDVEPIAIRPDLEEQLQSKDKVVLADYNKVIETIEITLLELNVNLDYKKKIPLFEMAYRVYQHDKNIEQVKKMVTLIAS